MSTPPAGTAALESEPTAQRADRGGALSFPVVMSTFGVLLALAIGLAVVIHRTYVGFVRVAAHHVPPDTSLVVRWDVEKVGLFEPTRRFLLPLLDRAYGVQVMNAPPGVYNANGTPTPSSPRESRRERFAREGGAMIGRDLREAVALFGPGEHDWAVVLAGAFAKRDMVGAAARVLEQEGWSWRSVGGGRLESPEGPALGQATDGAFVIASSVKRLDAVLVSRALLPEVPREGAGSLRVVSDGGGLPQGADTVLGLLGSPTEVDASAEWGSPLPVRVTLRYPGPPPADAKDRVRRAMAVLLPGDLPRIEHTEAPVRVQSAGNQAVTATILLDDIALEHAAARVSRAAGGDPGVEPAIPSN